MRLGVSGVRVGESDMRLEWVGMGRERIGERVLVVFPLEHLARIDGIMGKGLRSEFIREAVRVFLDAKGEKVPEPVVVAPRVIPDKPSGDRWAADREALLGVLATGPSTVPQAAARLGWMPGRVERAAKQDGVVWAYGSMRLK